MLPGSFVLATGLLRSSRGLPVFESRVPSCTHRANALIQHRYGEDTKAVLAIGFGFRDVRTIAT